MCYVRICEVDGSGRQIYTGWLGRAKETGGALVHHNVTGRGKRRAKTLQDAGQSQLGFCSSDGASSV